MRNAFFVVGVDISHHYGQFIINVYLSCDPRVDSVDGIEVRDGIKFRLGPRAW